MALGPPMRRLALAIRPTGPCIADGGVRWQSAAVTAAASAYAGSGVRAPETAKAQHGAAIPARPGRRMGLARLKRLPGGEHKAFVVNESADELAAFYRRIGVTDEMELPEALQWQAVTHKTFDHGFQPYNEKLYYMGKRARGVCPADRQAKSCSSSTS